jgi:glycosyltransferase involved in cell wall biosynthesis
MDFSIITPTFRQPEWLRLCVASVLDQERVTFEHIIQDGGDGEGLEWLGGNPRVRFFCEKDHGMYDAVKKGISKSSGRIIAHLNSDEQYLPGTLRLVKEFFDAHSNVDVLFGDAILVDATAKPLSYRRIVLPSRAHTIGCHLGTSSCSTFFRRKLACRGLGYTSDWRQVGDAALVLSWLDAGVKMATVHRPLAVFTFTGVNMFTGSEAREERARLRENSSLGPLAIPLLLATQHRLRKLLHGAYRARDIEIEIFRRKTPGKREKIRADKLGFSWPNKA